MFTYQTKGTCSTMITFDVDEQNKLRNVRFLRGCNGNLQGVSKLVEGRDMDEVVSLLSGIRCRGNTSCPDQLAQAILQYKESLTQEK